MSPSLGFVFSDYRFRKLTPTIRKKFTKEVQQNFGIKIQPVKSYGAIRQVPLPARKWLPARKITTLVQKRNGQAFHVKMPPTVRAPVRVGRNRSKPQSRAVVPGFANVSSGRIPGSWSSSSAELPPPPSHPSSHPSYSHPSSYPAPSHAPSHAGDPPVSSNMLWETGHFPKTQFAPTPFIPVFAAPEMNDPRESSRPRRTLPRWQRSKQGVMGGGGGRGGRGGGRGKMTAMPAQPIPTFHPPVQVQPLVQPSGPVAEPSTIYNQAYSQAFSEAFKQAFHQAYKLTQNRIQPTTDTDSETGDSDPSVTGKIEARVSPPTFPPQTADIKLEADFGSQLEPLPDQPENDSDQMSRQAQTNRPANRPAKPRPVIKVALLIGIEYTDYSRKGQLERLPGCHRDITMTYNLLTSRMGYAPANIIMLMDDNNRRVQPTRRNILNALSQVVARCRKDSSIGQVTIYYSGHGSQAQDRNSDETDGADECIVPCDFVGAGMITDDMFRSNFCNVLPPTVTQVTGVFDSCHSGTIFDLPFLYDPVTGPRQNQASSLTSPTNFITLSGCRDPQTAASAYDLDRNSLWEGALSFCLRQALKQQNYQPMIPTALADAVNGLLKERNFSQIPQVGWSRSVNSAISLF